MFGVLWRSHVVRCPSNGQLKGIWVVEYSYRIRELAPNKPNPARAVKFHVEKCSTIVKPSVVSTKTICLCGVRRILVLIRKRFVNESDEFCRERKTRRRKSTATRTRSGMPTRHFVCSLNGLRWTNGATPRCCHNNQQSAIYTHTHKPPNNNKINNKKLISPQSAHTSNKSRIYRDRVQIIRRRPPIYPHPQWAPS